MNFNTFNLLFFSSSFIIFFCLKMKVDFLNSFFFCNLFSSSLSLNLLHYKNLNYQQIIKLYQEHLQHKQEIKKQQHHSQEESELQQILNELLSDSFQSSSSPSSSSSSSLISQPRHILTILSDDQGWNDIGFHDPTFVSPLIDHLANNGITLNNFYVQVTILLSISISFILCCSYLFLVYLYPNKSKFNYWKICY